MDKPGDIALAACITFSAVCFLIAAGIRFTDRAITKALALP